jgi:hypothetical protein
MRASVLRKSGLILCATGFLIGCATTNEAVGTGVGVLVGAMVGKAIGGDRGAVVGAAIGGAVGYDLGRRLDARDRQKLAETRQRALAQSSQQSFYAQSAKSYVVVTPGPATYVPSNRQIALAQDVRRVEIIESVEAPGAAMADIPVYREPGFSAAPKLIVPKAAMVARIAYVKADSNWVLIGERDFGVGYVPAIYFDPEIAPRLASATNRSADASPVPAVRPEAAGRPAAKKLAPGTQPTLPQSPPSRTDELLTSKSTYLPPADHLRQRPMPVAEYRQVVDTGHRASRERPGDVTVVKPVVECKELTAVLLTDNRETGREVTKACRRGGADTWS